MVQRVIVTITTALSACSCIIVAGSLRKFVATVERPTAVERECAGIDVPNRKRA
jgi:hypothetical protein